MAAKTSSDILTEHSWTFGTSGSLDSSRRWVNPQSVSTSTTANGVLNALSDHVMNLEDDFSDLFFGKGDNGGTYLPSNECLKDVGIEESLQCTFAWSDYNPEQELTLEQFKLVFCNIVASIAGINNISEELYKQILVIEMRRVSRGRVSEKQVRIWTTSRISKLDLQNAVNHILQEDPDKKDFFVPNSLKYTFSGKF
jgi:hypothetical protein